MSPAKRKRQQKKRVSIASDAPSRVVAWNRDIGALIVIVVLGVIIYGRCVTFDYSLYDDPNIIFDNPNIQSGLTLKSIVWAFTTPNFGLYQPLPSLTYMVDSHFFGDWPGGYHAMTLGWHLLATCVFFILVRGLLDNFHVAFGAALFFAAHPVNAMSVNWVMARNETMPGFFLLLSVEAYRRYAVSGSGKARGASVVFMALAFMGKQSGVLLPVLLLLLDYWPLRRIEVSLRNPGAALRKGAALAREKLPWCVVSVAGVLLAFYGKSGEFRVLERNTFATPINNLGGALVAYARYLFHFVYPVRYLFSFPTDSEWITVGVGAAALISLAAITVAAVLLRDRRPYLLVGWGWFVLMLLPVSGLVAYAHESIALRYMYMPAMGLYLVIACALYDMATNNKGRAPQKKTSPENEDEQARQLRRLYWLPVVIITAAWAALCFWQSGFWRDSEALAMRALKVTDGDHALAHNHLGIINERRGNRAQADEHTRAAALLEPFTPLYQYNYANVLLREQRYDEARRALEPVMEMRQNSVFFLNRFGEALRGLERSDEAVEYFQRAVDIDPGFVNALYNLAECLIDQQKPEQARPYLERIVRGAPGYRRAKELLESLQ